VSQAGASVLEVAHLREHDRLRRYVMKHLAKADLPRALVVHAREDEVASLSNVRWLEKNCQLGQIQVVLLDNSYHMITIDNDREQVCEASLDFLSVESFPARVSTI
jgi:carboxylesterase